MRLLGLGLAKKSQARGILKLLLQAKKIRIRNHGELRFAIVMNDFRFELDHGVSGMLPGGE